MAGALKQTTDKLVEWFEDNATINEVTLGDVGEIDLTGYTDFPLVHVIYVSTTYPEGIRTYNYQILALDTYDDVTEEKLDVIDRMDEVLSTFVSELYHGVLFSSRLRVFGTPRGTVMYDQLQNKLYGTSLDVAITVPNGVKIC